MNANTTSSISIRLIDKLILEMIVDQAQVYTGDFDVLLLIELRGKA